MWPSFSSLKCLAAGASRFVVARKTTPVSNLLLHTSAANKESGCSPCQSNEDAWISQPGYIEPCADQNEQVRGRVAVVLCGCGYFDGSDPLEVIPLCVHLNRHGFTPVFFAPNKQFCSKWNYLDMFWNERGQGEQFDMAVEAARVPGHPVQDLRVLAETACNYRGLIIPGGQGVLRNLSAIMDRRANLVRVPTRTDVPPMNTDLSNALQTFNSGGLPIGCISYAGFLVAQQFPGVRVTVGNYRRPINATGTRNDPSDLAMITWESALFYATAFGVNIIPQEDEYVMRCSTYNVYSTAGSLSENMSYYATHQNIDRLVHDMLILFGGGSEDGSHPTEALSLAIDLDRRGVQTDFFAPNCKVPKVYDHQEKKESPENRNCLTESTRMAPVTPIYREDAAYGRGYLVNVDHPQPVYDINKLSPFGYDGIIIPGGRGVLNYVCSKDEGGRMVFDTFKYVLTEFKKTGKPIGCTSEAGLLVARALRGVTITLGGGNEPLDRYRCLPNLKEQACELQARHQDNAYWGVTHCPLYNVYSTPSSIDNFVGTFQVYASISNLVFQVIENITERLNQPRRGSRFF
ncbi:hypothetical protein TKK_0019051 [Trichogramma kaykai]